MVGLLSFGTELAQVNGAVYFLKNESFKHWKRELNPFITPNVACHPAGGETHVTKMMVNYGGTKSRKFYRGSPLRSGAHAGYILLFL